jgi:hypothetical protein
MNAAAVSPVRRSASLTLTFYRGDLSLELRDGAVRVYEVSTDGPIRGRELVWVETADDPTSYRIVPASALQTMFPTSDAHAADLS